jgi:exosortase C (VPDSG-CTERM-specific)
MNLETRPTNSSPAAVTAAPAAIASPGDRFAPLRPRFKGMIVFTIILLLAFILPLCRWVVFALHSELYSHTLLIPFVSGYLIWTKRENIVVESQPNRPLAFGFMVVGALVAGSCWFMGKKHGALVEDDYLAAMTVSFWCFLVGGGFIFLGAKFLKSIALPVAFLFFSVPYPQFVHDGIETFFQQGSTEVSYAMLKIVGMPVLRTGTIFQMPGFALRVAPECSGIHSSIILLITSVVAAYLFMKSSWRRWVLVLCIIPLALVRNGFRIFTLSELGVHVGPQVMNSPLHHHGGPLFFLLSLVPLFFLLLYLTKSELRKEQAMAVGPQK